MIYWVLISAADNDDWFDDLDEVWELLLKLIKSITNKNNPKIMYKFRYGFFGKRDEIYFTIIESESPDDVVCRFEEFLIKCGTSIRNLSYHDCEIIKSEGK